MRGKKLKIWGHTDPGPKLVCLCFMILDKLLIFLNLGFFNSKVGK